LKAKIHNSVGIILFCRFPRSVKYLLIKQHQGHWGFPKGHIEKNEKKIDTARRELKEETGIRSVSLLQNKILLNDEYSFFNGNGKIIKRIGYYIGETKEKKVKIDGKEILNYKWCTFSKALDKITFTQTKNVLKKARKFIKNGK
jgi:8-oxo-dGTP pyrophosphatase MutT (NUDIX family)